MARHLLEVGREAPGAVTQRLEADIPQDWCLERLQHLDLDGLDVDLEGGLDLDLDGALDLDAWVGLAVLGLGCFDLDGGLELSGAGEVCR